ncbi:MAG: DUF3015 family protein [Planctomycetes bacterium]|nr:DUF3015 family protein [Planctomycetota bacterium]
MEPRTYIVRAAERPAEDFGWGTLRWIAGGRQTPGVAQTFGISTGTSNCKAQNLVMTEKAVQYFTEVNKDDLSREMAKGQGEKLNTLAALYGCETATSRNEFAKAAQANYGKILPTAQTSVTEMVQNLQASNVVSACHTN